MDTKNGHQVTRYKEWTDAEDKALLRAVASHETNTAAFASVAKILPARTEGSCSARYYALRNNGGAPDASVLRNRNNIVRNNEAIAAEIMRVTSDDEREYLIPVSLHSIKVLIDQLSPEQRAELISNYIS